MHLVQDDSKKTASELSMDNVGGVFVVLMAGMGLGTLNHRENTWNFRTNLSEKKDLNKINFRGQQFEYRCCQRS